MLVSFTYMAARDLEAVAIQVRSKVQAKIFFNKCK